MTIGELLRSATAALEEHSIPSASLTAEVLLAHCIGRDRTFLFAHPECVPDEEATDLFVSMIKRRSAREPLQYITGKQEFYGRRFSVNPAVLIPRPETELVVEAVLELNQWPEPQILDVGTGSGCIAITLALELEHAKVYASDVSLAALQTAQENALENHADVRFACADLLDGWGRDVEFIVSNPPYIGTNEREGLQPEVRQYEPALALFGELEPASLYARLLADASERLVSGGYLVLEIGYSMEESVGSLFDSKWRDLRSRYDLQGFPRVLSARRV